ncbi:MAG: Zn-ribbon domain-containing OB-fold protein [Anaerolineales bacterium]
MYGLHHPFERPSHYQGLFPVTNRYTYGVAGEKFFRALKDEGVILGTRCPECQRIYVPGTLFCQACFKELNDWVIVENVGVVETYTLLYQDVDGSKRVEPEIIAFIRMHDGGFIHKIGEIDINSVHIGMQVAAVFKAPEERTGSILDIKYFKPT